MPLCWEEIYNDWEDPGCVRTFRAEVHGGWLVKDWSYDFKTIPPRHDEPDHLPYIASSMVFIPDPNHEWVISEEL
jgi:hypothetical protein